MISLTALSMLGTWHARRIPRRPKPNCLTRGWQLGRISLSYLICYICHVNKYSWIVRIIPIAFANQLGLKWLSQKPIRIVSSATRNTVGDPGVLLSISSSSSRSPTWMPQFCIYIYLSSLAKAGEHVLSWWVFTGMIPILWIGWLPKRKGKVCTKTILKPRVSRCIMCFGNDTKMKP